MQEITVFGEHKRDSLLYELVKVFYKLILYTLFDNWCICAVQRIEITTKKRSSIRKEQNWNVKDEI
jgi:hypothetical protein